MMTEKERYDLIIQELAEIIRQKNDQIYMQKYQISALEDKIKAAENPHRQRIETRGEIA